MYSKAIATALISLVPMIAAAAPGDDLLKAAGAATVDANPTPGKIVSRPPADNPKAEPSPAKGAAIAKEAPRASAKTVTAEPLAAGTSVERTSTGSVPRSTGVGRVDDLSREQFEIDRLEQSDRRMGVQLSIAEKQRRLSQIGQQGSPAQVPATQQGPVKVVGVEGSGNALIATLRFAGGEEIEARAGDTLPDGRTVRRVTATGVTLVVGKQEQHVPVVMTAGRAAAAATPSLPSERILIPMGAPVTGGGAATIPPPASR